MSGRAWSCSARDAEWPFERVRLRTVHRTKLYRSEMSANRCTALVYPSPTPPSSPPRSHFTPLRRFLRSLRQQHDLQAGDLGSSVHSRGHDNGQARIAEDLRFRENKPHILKLLDFYTGINCRTGRSTEHREGHDVSLGGIVCIIPKVFVNND
ncbi:hypothetical protein EVAR_51024_1 [Eumeta japonica]|uniref:Uncharacterized protein n=1 Tax=Eumeta variegata TaxID=151549 RepID=A0A4C1Y8J5_EUMVA|nr:hypothetical protein EVAR_51024_1 [Eumeta japonica]